MFQKLNKYNNIYFVDMSWVLHRSYHAYKGFTANIDGYDRPTGHIYGVLRTIRMLRASFPDTAVVVCVDGIPERKKEFGGYKASREAPEFPFMKDVGPCLDLLLLLDDVYVAVNPKLESDDLMFAMSRDVLPDGAQGYIYSGDDDLLQGIKENVAVVREFKSGKPIRIDRDYVVNDRRMVEKYHGVEPWNLPTYRSIVGDKSDEIPGVPRFPRDIAAKLAVFKDYDDIMARANFASPKGLKAKEMLKQYEDQIKLNDSLMRLQPFERLENAELTKLITRGYMDVRFAYCLVDIFNLASMRWAVPKDWVTPVSKSGRIIQQSVQRWSPLIGR